jgi:hypothetical protein
MGLIEVDRVLLRRPPMMGAVPHHCSRCVWGIMMDVRDTITKVGDMFNNHHCADYPETPKATPVKGWP